MVDTALDLFKQRQAAGRASVLVFYRGERSFFCRQWLRRWLSIPGFDRRLDLADVFLFFVSSQSQGKAYSVADQIAGKKPILDTRVFFFGDPEHLLVDYLAESGLAHPVVTNPDSHRAHGWVFDYGMVQPAVLAIAADSSVLYEWTSKPSLLNVAGKLDRPDPWDAWDKIEQRIDRIRITKARAARRAIATRSSAVSPVKEGSIISSDAQSQPNTPEAHTIAGTSTRLTPKHSNLPNAAHLSLKSLASAPQMPVVESESPEPVESPGKEPKSTEENHEDETEAAPTGRPQFERDSSANDAFSSVGADRHQVKPGSEGEETNAPPSTAIDLLSVGTSKPPLSQEERCNSEDDMSKMHVQQLSGSINALATEALADKNMSLTDSKPEAVAKLPKLAEEVVLSQHQAEPLTDDEFEREMGNVVDGTVSDDDVGEKPNESPKSEPLEDVGSSTRFENDKILQVGTEIEYTLADDVGSRMDEKLVCLTERVPEAQTENNIDATESETRNTEGGPLEEHFVKEVLPANLNTSITDNALESETGTCKEASASVSFEASRTSELFDLQDSGADTLETSAASLSSDQVDSTTAVVKHPSVRTEDSTQINSLAGFEASSFPSERRIPEEADDKKTGISDYLKELKDPSKLKDPRYRSRFDPLPPIVPPGCSTLSSSSGTDPKRESASGSSSARDANLTSNIGLTQGLIQQETRMPPSETSRRDSSQRNREPRLSHRSAPPVAVYIADQEPITPPPVAQSPLSGQSPEPMAVSPHPEGYKLSRAGTVDVTPFADADHEMAIPEDHGTKLSLRDEYEAYDEYIVCEYEVEEYVEEYESDTFSKSKVFVTTVVDDSSEDEESMRTASESRTLHEASQFDHCNVVDVKGTARGVDPNGRVRVWKESGGRSRATVSPTVEANILHRQVNSHSMSPVRVLLRKIGVKGVRRARGTEDATSTEDTASARVRDPARIRRKDTFRSVLRKAPRNHVTTAGTESIAEADEEEAKLGRKETIKAVLRKIPVPKNLKRVQTEVALDGQEENDRPTSPFEEAGSRSSKRGGLQSVLQRLPSLSSVNRHRGSARLEMMSAVTSTNEIDEVNKPEMGSEAETRNRGATTITEEVRGERPGVFRRALSRLAQTDGPGSGAAGGADADVETGVNTGGSGALSSRRNVTWREEGEKVAGKMSFAVVGGRILSKFKM